MTKGKLHSMFTTNHISFGVRPDKVNLEQMTYAKNILITPKGLITPRTPGNLKKLRQYTQRRWGKPTDRRTKAYKQWYRYMVLHDSEFMREQVDEE
jgi:hypothetical protein